MKKGVCTLDLDGVDEWAVDVAVREGVRMNLSEAELVMATGRLIEERGWGREQVAARLHISVRKADALFKRWQRLETAR